MHDQDPFPYRTRMDLDYDGAAKLMDEEADKQSALSAGQQTSSLKKVLSMQKTFSSSM